MFLRLLVLLVACAACGGPRTPSQDPLATPHGTVETPVLAAGSGLKRLAEGRRGAVASVERHASVTGIKVLRAGGNAIDAAVAVGFVLAVTHPSAGNLGGGGFMVLRTPSGTFEAIDFRETAPAGASRDMYLDEAGKLQRTRVRGPLAAGVPGTVAGLALAHARHGKLAWSELLAPAIDLAERGHVIDEAHARILARGVRLIREAGYEQTLAAYTDAKGESHVEGHRWKQPALAKTLRRIAAEGAAGFYEGPVAVSLVKASRAGGGIWRLADLAAYKARLRPVVRFPYRGHEVISMPPPSAGGVVLRQMLGMTALRKAHSYPWRSAESYHLTLEAARRAYVDRNTLLADPDFVQLDLGRLLSEAYVAAKAESIDPAQATDSAILAPAVPARPESPQTTHYSVLAADGSAVATTVTLNFAFGCRYADPATGVLFNNEMDDFATQPGQPNAFGLVQGERNAIAPGKRMLSSMSPTLLVRDGAVRAVLGAMGGSTITTTVAQQLRAIVDYDQPVEAVLEAARLHHQWLPDRVLVEARTEAPLRAGLEALGHEVQTTSYGGEGVIGRAHIIERNAEGMLRAAADVTRGAGYGAAY